MRSKLAVLCFIPDTGHIMPLLRIAKMAILEGYEVKFFTPIDAKPLINEYEFAADYLLPGGDSKSQRLLTSMSNAGDIYRELYLNYKLMNDHLLQIKYSLNTQIENIKEQLQLYNPSLILADDRLIPEVYKYLSSYCNTPLVLHRSEGSNCQCQIDYPWLSYYESKKFIFLKKAAIVVNDIHAKCLRRVNKDAWNNFINARTVNNLSLKVYKEYLTQHPANFSHIGTGLGTLEKDFLANKITICPDIRLLPPAPPIETKKLPDDITAWLESDARKNVLYVCFGSMFSPPERLAKILLVLAEKLQIRILWSSKNQPCKHTLPNLDSSHFLWKKWVPQTSVLAHASVSGFLTHAGAGSIQESIWYGKPVICMPRLWDQPYNAWVCENLGFGINLHHKRITKSMLESVLRRLMIERQLDSTTHKMQKEVRQKSKHIGFKELVVDVQ